MIDSPRSLFELEQFVSNPISTLLFLQTCLQKSEEYYSEINNVSRKAIEELAFFGQRKDGRILGPEILETYKAILLRNIEIKKLVKHNQDDLLVILNDIDFGGDDENEKT